MQISYKFLIETSAPSALANHFYWQGYSQKCSIKAQRRVGIKELQIFEEDFFDLNFFGSKHHSARVQSNSSFVGWLL